MAEKEKKAQVLSEALNGKFKLNPECPLPSGNMKFAHGKWGNIDLTTVRLDQAQRLVEKQFPYLVATDAKPSKPVASGSGTAASTGSK